MAENPTSSSPPKPSPSQQNPAIAEPSNSQQLQPMQSASPSLDHQQQQQQLLQSQQQMGQAQQQMVQPQEQQLQQLQQQLQQQTSGNVGTSNNNNNLIGVSNFQGLQRNPSMSRLNHQMQQNSNINTQLGMMRQQQQQQNSGIYGQMNFGGLNALQPQTQQQNSSVGINNTNNNQQQQNQLQQQMGQQNQLQQQQQQIGQMASGNLSRSALVGQTGHLPLLSGQAASQFNLQNQFLTSVRGMIECPL